ncbi:MAG: 4a-hydroxytetrahydrobiopterin dehydratase [Bacteroidetes bacterium]|nr:4a-hydroxytetrahydrobiopterin dehydratase [Bacteroidota bacterium]MBP6314945.1 4a-hydroxytetrahydrobiopterin dehydratase [Chitinophagaceae bacterium]
MRKLSEIEITEKIKELPSWTLTGQALEKDFHFKNFSLALAFIVRIGIEAEKLNHHPEIKNIYSKVSIRLITHDVQAITNMDFLLANSIELAYRS